MKFLYLRTRYAFGLKAGGSVAHTSGVINALAKEHNIEVFTNDYLPEVKSNVNFVRPTRISFLPTAINEILYNWKIIRHLSNLRSYDTIYQRLSANSFCGAYLARRHNVDFILEYNGSEAWGLKYWNKQVDWVSPKGFFMNLYKFCFEIPLATLVERYSLKRASKIVVVSRELQRSLVKRNVSPSKIIVYPNGVDTQKFRPNISGRAVRNKLNLHDDIVFGFIGSFGQWHGIDVLADAINMFYRQYGKSKIVKFLLIGDGLKMPYVKRTLENHISQGRVVLPGIVKQEFAPKYLAACDVLVSPHVSNADGTNFFGSPTKLFEYMAMGKLILASDLEQLGEILEHEVDALLVPPGKADALCENMLKVTAHWDKKDFSVLGKNARKKVVENFTWGAHIKSFVGD